MYDDFKSTRKECKMTNSEKLREKIKSRGLKLKYIAECLRISPYTLQLKIDNEREFKTSEVDALCDVLEMSSLREKEEIFFAKKDD